MTKQELERQRLLAEAWRTFVDAINYEDAVLIGYTRLVRAILFCNHISGENDFLISQLNNALNTLSEPEQKVLSLRNGLDGSTNMTFKEIAKILGISSTDIRSIEQIALQKMRHPSRFDMCTLSKIRAKKVLELRFDHCKSIKKHRNINPMIDIEELDFSVKTFNCLKRANIDTIEELFKLTDAELIQIRYLSKKSYEEIQQKRKEFFEQFPNIQCVAD